MQPIYKSSALTVGVLAVLIILRYMDMETQKIIYQFLIFLSIVTATVLVGILATKYLTIILGGGKGKITRYYFLKGMAKIIIHKNVEQFRIKKSISPDQFQEILNFVTNNKPF